MTHSPAIPNHPAITSGLDSRRKQLKHHISGFLWMTGGSGVIFFLLLYMNQSALPDMPDKVAQQTTFEVKQAPRTKPRKKIERKRPKRSKTAPPPIPVLHLDSGLSGIDFGLPVFSLDAMGDIDQSLLGDTGNVVMTSEMVDQPPRVRQRAPLDYPPRARTKEIEGYVVMSLLIDDTGRVETVKVIEASPTGIFEEAAIRSVRHWLFEPARYEGENVQSWANQTIRFEQG